MPRVYLVIASRLPANGTFDRNGVFCLESILGRQIVGEPHKLKAEREIQQAMIRILDHLVDQGSSAAYRMRDDFIMPLGL